MKRIIVSTFFAVIVWFALGTAVGVGVELTDRTAKAGGPVTAVHADAAESGTAKEKVARLVPQPVAPPEEVTSGLKVVRLVVPTVSFVDIEPFIFAYRLNSEGQAVWNDNPDVRNEKGCWEAEYPDSPVPWSGGKNTVLWCHRGALVGTGIIDLANLKVGDPIWIWAEDTNEGFYALEFTVRWLGQLPRKLETDFLEPTDGWVLTFVTCALEPGLPANPLERIFIRATIDEETNFGVWHYVSSGETLSSLAKTFGTTTAELAKANGLADPNRIKAGDFLFIPLAPGKIDLTFKDLP